MKERSVGLDIYRITAILMITTLHINYQHCGLLYNNALPANLYCAGIFIEYLCFAGVNCFAMLSGYLNINSYGTYDRKWLSRTVAFWLKIILWGLFLYVLIRNIFPGGGGYYLNLKSTLLPISSFWWYISAYCGLLIFMPLLNTGLNRCSVRETVVMIAAIFVLFSVIPAWTKYDSAILNDGYSTIWLIICFIFGAAVKKLSPYILKIKRINLLLIILLAFSVLCPIMLQAYTGQDYMNFTTPFCVLQAICMLLLFIQIRINNPAAVKIISFVSLNSLGIYLVQNYPFFWENYICRSCIQIYPALKYLWYIPSMILLLMSAGVITNLVVEKLFTLLGCDKLCRKIAGQND